jgi:excisionase family DNA binding protein
LYGPYLTDNGAVVSGRSGRGRSERVVAARQQARKALGRDPEAEELSDAPPQRKVALPEAFRSIPVPSYRHEPVLVLSLGEAATRLGISRTEIEAMIASGALEALPTGYTQMIPKREIERLKSNSRP